MTPKRGVKMLLPVLLALIQSPLLEKSVTTDSNTATWEMALESMYKAEAEHKLQITDPL